MSNEKREKDFAKASAQFDGIHAQVAFVSGCEHGYQYAVEKAVEFLKEKEFGDWIEQEASSFIEDFRKAMQ